MSDSEYIEQIRLSGTYLGARKAVWRGTVGLLLGLVWASLVACQKSPESAGVTAKDTAVDRVASSGAASEVSIAGTEVHKSEFDTRDYHYLELPNRLRVLLISDPEAKKAAVSMDVSVGSGDDPAEREGLAHFLEHMLFLGTEKYPTAGAYQAFIAANGGQHNAYTSFNNTNYFFDINADQLAPALAQFSQFFVSPLFTAKYVEREKNAVNSEYRAKLKNEARRTMDAVRATLNPEHPLSQFSVGSLETLADRENSAIRDELITFYEQHYSANRMNLVVLGQQPIAELQRLVEQRFAEVKDRDTAVQTLTQPLFAEGTLPARLLVTPEQNIRNISLAFPVPDPLPEWRAKPLLLLGDVLGHEGEGSLLQYLKQQGWAESLSAGMGVVYHGGALFNIDVALTEAGYQQRDEVVTAIFQAINRLREEGISQQRFDEQRKISDIGFRYAERGENVHYVMGLAARMAYYPASMAVLGPYLLDRYEPALYDEYLAALKPDNLLLTVTGPELATPERSELYQTPYALLPLTAQPAISRWQQAGVNPAIVMPAPNPFIPEQFTRLTASDHGPRPEAVYHDEQVAIWHGDDARFSLPKASVRLLLNSPMVTDSARNAVLLDLYASLLSDALNAKLYPAQLVGFKTQFAATRRGLQVNVSGFSDKQSELWQLLATQLQQAEFEPRRFQDVKQRLLRGWQNARRKAPYQYLPVAQREVLYEPFWGDRERLAVVDAITLEQLVEFHRQLLSDSTLEMLIYGNLTTADALVLRDSMAPLIGWQEGAKGMVKGQPVVANSVAVVKLKDPAHWRFDVPLPHDDAAIAWYVQGADDSNEQRVLMGLTGQIIRTPYYQSLRTEQQLGYIVYAAPTVLERTPGLTFTVQSPVADAGKLYQASLDMLRQFGATVDTMSAETFAQHRQALLSLINRPHQNLASVAGYMWDQLLQRYLQFDRREQLSTALEQVTLAQWQAFYRHEFLPEPRRSVLVFSAGARPIGKGSWASLAAIANPEIFKQDNAQRQYP